MFTIDLLLISGYLKTYRNRMEIKTDDVSATKSIMYLAFRCFVDVFYFSVLENLSADFITTNVLEHFKHYDEKGFFKKFNENMSVDKFGNIELPDYLTAYEEDDENHRGRIEGNEGKVRRRSPHGDRL